MGEFTQDEEFSRLLIREFQVTHIKDLHVKAMVTTRLAYIGSANITYNGLYVNREQCRLERVHKKAAEIVREFLT